MKLDEWCDAGVILGFILMLLLAVLAAGAAVVLVVAVQAALGCLRWLRRLATAGWFLLVLSAIELTLCFVYQATVWLSALSLAASAVLLIGACLTRRGS